MKSLSGQLNLETAPYNLVDFKTPIELRFTSSRKLRGGGPDHISWSIQPGTEIRALILPPNRPYLGNHRVEQEHYAVQWNLEARIDSESRVGNQAFLAQLSGGSRIKFTWVEEFPLSTNFGKAVTAAWKNFRSPFDPGDILQLKPRQVIHWTWRGGLELKFSVGLDLIRGWQFGRSGNWGAVVTALNTVTGAEASVVWSQKGEFTLRVSRRRGRTQLSLIRGATQRFGGDLRFGLSAGHSIRLKGPHRQLDPLLAPVKTALKKSVNRKLQLGLALEWERWKRKRILLRAEWKVPGARFTTDYQTLLEGRLPKPHAGLKATWRLEHVLRHVSSIRLNFFDWYRLERTTRKEESLAVSVDAAGDILIEKRQFLERTKISGSDTEIIRLLAECNWKSQDVARFVLSFEQSGEFTRSKLGNLLRSILRVRSIDQFDLPPDRAFPARLVLIWISEFSYAGIEQVRQADAERRWQALVRSFELFQSDRYRSGGFHRDWIESEVLRRTADEDPVGVLLESRYPVPGRSAAERRIVAAQYRAVRRFLSMMDDWQQEREINFGEVVSGGLNVPVFAYFHLLSTRQHRRSLVAVSGDFHRAWGETLVNRTQ